MQNRSAMATSEKKTCFDPGKIGFSSEKSQIFTTPIHIYIYIYIDLSGPGSQRLGTGLLWPGQSWQGGKGDSRDTSTFVTSCPIGMSLPADSSCEGRVFLHFTQPGLSMAATAGVVVERGSEYILAHTGPRELDWHPLGGCGSGFWFSSRLYI